jgi:hypothetical protein
MRLCAALALVLVALVVLTVKVARRHPRHAPAPAATEVAALEAPVPTPARAPARIAHGESGGIALLRGRLLFPAGVERMSSLEVVAESGARRFHALIPDNDRFEIHLPGGRYTLIASMGELVGVTPDVLARGGATRDVDIRLVVGAAIRGKIGGASGAIVSAVPSGASVRTLKLTGVLAPTDGLDVEMQARAKIRGAIGFPRGTRCPIDNVRLQIPGEESAHDDSGPDIGADCTFALSVPDKVTDVNVLATGKGWYLEQLVAIPPRGDPEPVCLNPPCRSDPFEGMARLRLALDGPEGSSISAQASEVDESSSGGLHACSGSAGRCDIEGLPAGGTLSITASGDGCHADPITVTVVAGDNHVRIPCERQRRIEGVIRIPESSQPDRVVIRCAGGDLHPIAKTRLFRVTCAASATALEYQIGTQGTWRSVPIAAGTDLAFVDIGW